MTEESEQRRPFDPSTGLLNNRYELQEFLGQGSMGAVYKAHDRELGRTVAIKCVLNEDDGGSNDRAMREAKTLATLSHPNIIRVYDVVSYRDQVSLVTEWIEGSTLNELNVPLGPVEVIAIATQLFRGLSAAHRLKIFHRDIKPANIMLARDGRLVLLDFGVAFSPGKSSGETIAGSLRYAAPEVLEGHPPSEQSDMFAAGLVIAELLLGYPLVPDLAPLPLYRYHREKFVKSAQRAFNGIYPPLATFLKERLFVQESMGHQEMLIVGDAERSAAFMHEQFHELTDKTVEDFLEQSVCRGVKDEQIENRLTAKTEQALEDTELSPKDKALWFAYQDHSPKQRIPQIGLPVIGRRFIAKFPTKNLFKSPKQYAQKHLWLSLGAIAAVIFAVMTALYLSKSGPFSTDSNTFVSAISKDRPEQQVQVMKDAVKEALREAVQEAVNEDSPAKGNQSIDSETNPNNSKPTSNTADGGGPSDSESSSAKIDKALSKLAAPRNSSNPEPADERVPVSFAANAWADISIDGLNIGRLPSTNTFSIRVGTRKVRLESPFVEPLETEIVVTRAPEQRFRFTLKPKSVVRVIRLANPAEIIIDGTEHGFSKEKTVTMTYGTHEIWVKRGGQVLEKMQIAVGPDSPEVIVVE